MYVRPPAASVARVIAGVDGSAGSATALRWAADEAWRRQAGLRVVSAWQEAAETGLSCAGNPARIAAACVEKALAYVLSRHEYACSVTGTAVRVIRGRFFWKRRGKPACWCSAPPEATSHGRSAVPAGIACDAGAVHWCSCQPACRPEQTRGDRRIDLYIV